MLGPRQHLGALAKFEEGIGSQECGAPEGPFRLLASATFFGPTSERRSDKVLGFSLLELLVVASVIGILLALLLPGLQAAHRSTRRTICANNLRQLALAGREYHEARQCFPPGLEQSRFSTPPRFRGTSLFAFLMPFLEEGQLTKNWDYERPLRNADGGRKARTAIVPPVLLCPSDPIESNPIQVAERYFGITSYGGNGGSRSSDPADAPTDGIFHTTGPASEPRPDQQPVRIEQIRDGTSQTILFGERCHDDPHYETFARRYWTQSLRYLGRWAAIGGRRRILDVTLSGSAPINYQMPYPYDQRLSADPPLQTSRAFLFYEAWRTGTFGSGHSGGAMFAFVDGSVHFLSDSIVPECLQAMCTRAGHDTPAFLP